MVSPNEDGILTAVATLRGNRAPDYDMCLDQRGFLQNGHDPWIFCIREVGSAVGLLHDLPRPALPESGWLLIYWRLISPLKRLLAKDAPVSLLGRLLALMEASLVVVAVAS
ncbi:hypothetical protein CRG98_015713 [Punica granatum]|uniref:Uncharacterized protein n=1 Tax=Punica granatum TaxID=22663 RepID=A0A2I0K5V7_PUNGR|nr:hypothetical protein CRG98_015713 [Punica granatum]